MADEEAGLSLPLVYVDVDEINVLLCNQVVSQFHQDGFVVTFGQVAPPILLGEPEEQRRQAMELSYVPVRVLTRLSFTPDRMRELLRVLQTNLDGYEKSQQTENG